MKGLCSWLCDGHKSEAVASGGPNGSRVGGGRHRGQVFGEFRGQRSWRLGIGVAVLGFEN